MLSLSGGDRITLSPPLRVFWKVACLFSLTCWRLGGLLWLCGMGGWRGGGGFRILVLVCAFPVWGGAGLPCPPLCVSSGTWLVFFLLHAGVWEGAGGNVGGGVAWGGGLGGLGGCGGVGVASCYLPEQG